ncbi:MAG: hypothetical protein K8T25_10780 [Planctomycetia bacterium]|nr:hypothetical protein [Planctomycetia bacterium]
MLNWLQKLLGARQQKSVADAGPETIRDSTRSAVAVDFSSIPDDARRMIALIDAHKDHPLVKEHFYQVAIVTLIVPGSGEATMYLPEFRDGLNAALIWDDAKDQWGSGGWIPVAHAEADITCPPSAFGMQYMQGNPAFPTVAALLSELYGTRPSQQH